MKKSVLSARGRPVYLAGDSSVDGAGCWFHFDYLASKTLGSDGDHLFAVIPEPSNPFDPHAVALSLDNRHVGYLPAAEAKAYAPILSDYIAKGFVPFIRGTLRAHLKDANDYHPKPWFYVYMSLRVADVYPPPPRVQVGTLSGAAQLASEGAHLIDDEAGGYPGQSGPAERTALDALIRETSGEYALARLVLLPADTPGKRRRVGVQWNGLTVARLSAVSSGRYLGPMEAAERQGQSLVARIRVPRLRLRRETETVMVFIPRELELDSNDKVKAEKHFLAPRPDMPFDADIGVESYGRDLVTVRLVTFHPEPSDTSQ